MIARAGTRLWWMRGIRRGGTPRFAKSLAVVALGSYQALGADTFREMRLQVRVDLLKYAFRKKHLHGFLELLERSGAIEDVPHGIKPHRRRRRPLCVLV